MVNANGKQFQSLYIHISVVKYLRQQNVIEAPHFKIWQIGKISIHTNHFPTVLVLPIVDHIQTLDRISNLQNYLCSEFSGMLGSVWLKLDSVIVFDLRYQTLDLISI